MNHKHPSLSSSYAPYEYMYVDNRCYFSIYIPSTGRSCWWSASPSIKQQKVNLFRPIEPLFTVTPGQSYLIDCINELTLVVAATNIKFKSASQCVMSREFFFIITSLYSVRLKKLWMDKIKLLWWHGLTVINLLIEEKDFKLQIKLFAHTSFQFHLWIFTRWCDSTFFHVIYTVNHVTKRRTTSLGKDSEMESEACVCQKFYLEFETSFMLFTNSFLLKEVNCWKKHWYERVVNAFFLLLFC